ncbi:MAG: glycosyltransferase family 4 protein [Chloroflexota bacterium]
MTQQAQTPLRVLFVGVKWPLESFLARLVRGLADRGLRITLAAPQQPGSDWRSTANVDFLYTPGWTGSRAERLARTGYRLGAAALRSPADTGRVYREATQIDTGLSSAEQMYRWLPFAGWRWDVVYFPWNATAITYKPLMDRAPAIISCRGTQINVAPHNPQRAALREGLPETFAKAAAVHCVSEAICREATLYGLDREKSVIIRPAVDPDVFTPSTHKAVSEGVFRLVTTGSVIWRKGFEYALMAMDLLRRRGVPAHLEIIGTGDEDQRLLYTINDLGLQDCVDWLGLLPPAEVVGRLQQADAFLLPSLSEGISNAVLEAMACGLPVVVSDIDGMDEAVNDGVEGLLVPSRDAESMADALAYLWNHADERERMGAAARARILRDFRLDDQVTAFEQLFKSVV